MHVVQLKQYRLPAEASEAPLAPFDFSLAPGDVCVIQTDSPDLGHQFLEALAMIRTPVSGEYRFEGRLLSHTDYAGWLRFRSGIGYVGPVSALISNLSIRENLLLSRYYFENDLRATLTAEVAAWCRAAGLGRKMHLRPADLNPVDRRAAIAIRELSRQLRLIVFDSPEDLIGHSVVPLLAGELDRLHRQGVPVVWMGESEGLLRSMVNRNGVIAGGRLTAPGQGPG